MHTGLEQAGKRQLWPSLRAMTARLPMPNVVEPWLPGAAGWLFRPQAQVAAMLHIAQA